MSPLDQFLTDRRLTGIVCAIAGVFVVLIFLPTLQGAILIRQERGDPFEIANTRRPPIQPPGPIQTQHWDDLPAILGFRLVNGHSALDPAMPIPMQSRTYALLMGAQEYWDEGWKTMPSPLSTLRVRRKALFFDTSRPLPDEIDFANTALVEQSVSLDSNASGNLQWIENTNAKLRLLGQASGNVLCTIGVRYHRGWKMTLDNQTLPFAQMETCSVLRCQQASTRSNCVLHRMIFTWAGGSRWSVWSLSCFI